MRKALLDSSSSARRGFIAPAVLIILALICLFVAATLLFNTLLLKGQKQPTSTPSVSPTPAPKTMSDETANWKTYTSRYGYSFRYPPDFQVKSQWPENPSSEASAVSDVAIFSPDSRFNERMGNLITGLQLTVTVYPGSHVACSPVVANPGCPNRPNDKNVVVDDALIPAELTLPPGVSSIAYVQRIADHTVFTAVDFMIENPTVHYTARKETVKFGCIDPGEEERCRLVLPKILSTIKFVE